MTDDRPVADRRGVLGMTVGLTSLALPAAAAAASVSEVQAWSGTLTFSDATTTGFTVTWTAV